MIMRPSTSGLNKKKAISCLSPCLPVVALAAVWLVSHILAASADALAPLAPSPQRPSPNSPSLPSAVAQEETPQATVEAPAPTEKPGQTAGTRNTPKYSIRRNIVYRVVGHRQLKGDAYIPNGEGTYPGVLLLHGGGWKAGSRKQMIYHAKRLAPNGFVAFAIDYRLAPQYKFPTQIEDCRAAIQYMREHAAELKIDPDRIAAYGYSAGGHLACLLGTTDGEIEATTESENATIEDRVTPAAPAALESVAESVSQTNCRVQAVVAGGAPCDFEIVPADAKFLAYWLGGSRAEIPSVYRKASPLAAVTPDDAPMLFYHGQNDTLVPSFSSRRLKERLEEHGIRATFHLCEDKGHYRAFLDATAFRQALAFLNEELKPRPSTAVTRPSTQSSISIH